MTASSVSDGASEGVSMLPRSVASPAEHQGWVLAPLHPTDAMVEAGRIEGWDDPDHEASSLGHPWVREAVYEAMLAARPARPPASAADILEQVAKGQMLEGFRQKIGQAVARVIWDERWHDLDDASKGDAMRAAENVLLTFHAALDLLPSVEDGDGGRGVKDMLPPRAAQGAEQEIERLREALTNARIWHEAADKAISKQPNANQGQNGWMRCQHQEQIAEITEALEGKANG